MSIIINIADEAVGKSPVSVFDLEFATEQVSVREIITRRVEEEVARINAKNAETGAKGHRMALAGLLKTSPENLLNTAPKNKRVKMLNVDDAVSDAINAFRSGKYFLLHDDQQIQDLDEVITLSPKSRITFLKITPLVGG